MSRGTCRSKDSGLVLEMEPLVQLETLGVLGVLGALGWLRCGVGLPAPFHDAIFPKADTASLPKNCPFQQFLRHVFFPSVLLSHLC